MSVMQGLNPLVTIGVILFACFLIPFISALREKKQLKAVSYLIPLVIIGGGMVLFFLLRPQ